MNTAATRPGWVPDHLYPFESNYLEIDGCRVHYVDEGAGPILLFLHGAPTWSFLYRNIILGLRDSYRCIALDYPGCGLSSARPSYNFTAAEHADIVQRFVSDLDLRDATLMGHDWGGPIGLTVATRESDRFSGLILSNTWAWPLNGILHFELFGRVMGSPFMKLWIRHRNAFVTFMLPMATATRLSEEVMNAYRGPFPTPDRRRPSWEFPRELLRSKPFMQQLERNLPKIQQLPTLLLWGARISHSGRITSSRAFKSSFPTMRP